MSNPVSGDTSGTTLAGAHRGLTSNTRKSGGVTPLLLTADLRVATPTSGRPQPPLNLAQFRAAGSATDAKKKDVMRRLRNWSATSPDEYYEDEAGGAKTPAPALAKTPVSNLSATETPPARQDVPVQTRATPDSVAQPDPDMDLGDFDDARLDEDMLRDLVAEVLREELAGVLGERLTRNMRKLVRREINRTLLTREME